MKKGLFKAHAVVLNSFDFGESDRILTFYTGEYGKIKGIAKGARRSRKRFVGNLEPASCIRLIFFNSGTELVRVEDVTLLEAFGDLKADIDKFSQACYLLELVSEMTREGHALPPVFELLVGFLSKLGGGDGEMLLRFFEIRLLDTLGLLPYLKGCVGCKGSFDADERIFFSSDKGGALCMTCSANVMGVMKISPGTARSLSAAARLDADKLTRLKVNAVFLEECERVLYDFIRHQIGKELKTKNFLNKIRASSL